MSIALSTLVAAVTADVAARNGVPSVAQYGRCVTEAAGEFGRQCPMQRVGSFAIIAGTAAYTLPADFLDLISLPGLYSPDGILNTPNGLVPVGQGFQERWTINGLTLTFYPTPEYSAARQYRYMAGHVLTGGTTYDLMTDEDGAIVLHLARAKALTLQANIAAHEAWQYQFGDERVSMENLARELREQARENKALYDAAVDARRGAGGARGDWGTVWGW